MAPTPATPPAAPIALPAVLVLMGVAGCGKTTVAALLAGRLGWALEEGDGLHPRANVDKMSAGHALDDDDRAPWLERVADWAEARLDAGESGVITCSALKRTYRERIRRQHPGIVFVYLAGSRETIAARLAVRHDHFMPPSLLDSQFADLQPPAADEPAISVDVGPTPMAIAQTIVDRLGLPVGASR